MPSPTEIRDSIDFTPGQIDDVLRFLKRTRNELRDLRMVRVWPDRLEVIDINLDAFEIRGLGFLDTDISAVLDAINAVYDRATISQPTERPFKEFKTGRRHPWAEDRVM